MLRHLLDGYRPLLNACRGRPPDAIERSAIAAMLHAFYNGVENIFKRIAVECDGGVPGGPAAHRDLLDSMARPGPRRPRVISDGLRDSLDRYLDFRHFFRHAYTFDLRWDKMATEVWRCEDTLRQLEAELTIFMDSLRGTSGERD